MRACAHVSVHLCAVRRPTVRWLHSSCASICVCVQVDDPPYVSVAVAGSIYARTGPDVFLLLTDGRVVRGAIKPRQTASLVDMGYTNLFRQWVNVQGQRDDAGNEVNNDYARFVGEWPGYLSVALAGSTNEHTPPGQYVLVDGVVRGPILPRQTHIEDMGYPNQWSGWVDAQGQGVANDYARFVGEWPGYISVALAGSFQQKTKQGEFWLMEGNVTRTHTHNHTRTHIYTLHIHRGAYICVSTEADDCSLQFNPLISLSFFRLLSLSCAYH